MSFCPIQDPDVLDFDEERVLSGLLSELTFHWETARENIERAAKAYKARYDSQAGVRPLKFAIGDQVYVKTSHPDGQALGKTAHSHIGPYCIMDKIGDVLFKLQDVQSGAILASLKHGDVFTYQPDERSSTLCQLQGDHDDVPGQIQQHRAADIQADAESGDVANRNGSGVAETSPTRPSPPVTPVKQRADQAETSVTLPHIKQGKHLQGRTVSKQPSSKTKPDLPPSKTSGATGPSPSQHKMTLQGKKTV